MVVGADDEVIIGDENDGTMRAVAGEGHAAIWQYLWRLSETRCTRCCKIVVCLIISHCKLKRRYSNHWEMCDQQKKAKEVQYSENPCADTLYTSTYKVRYTFFAFLERSSWAWSLSCDNFFLIVKTERAKNRWTLTRWPLVKSSETACKNLTGGKICQVASTSHKKWEFSQFKLMAPIYIHTTSHISATAGPFELRFWQEPPPDKPRISLCMDIQPPQSTNSYLPRDKV